mmetsp:Transcript_19877/g.37061  ORF Transcript_19877/g.37061 Transcript_19877/m.37061 type:complete len:223 (+) Transcript_19877:279-947(+)
MPRSSLLIPFISSQPLLGTDFNCKYWLVLNPAGLFTAMLTIALHLWTWRVNDTQFLGKAAYGFYDDVTGDPVTPSPLTSSLRLLQITFSTLLLLLSLLSHLLCMLSNPGTIPPTAQPLTGPQLSSYPYAPSLPNPLAQSEALKKFHTTHCHKCSCYKPPRSHHSSLAGRCVSKLDHFCPWVCNCVGFGNHKYFLCFVFYTCWRCLFTFFNGIVVGENYEERE